MYRRILALLLCAVLFWSCAASACAEESVGPGRQLRQLVVLGRHHIRSPLADKGSWIARITPHDWFEWTSKPGELSPRGAMLAAAMGRYFRLWLEKEGLFAEDEVPGDGAVRFYANGLQRTQATARCFSAGLFPASPVPVECHVEYNQMDALFLPLILFMNEAYARDVRKEIAERGGGEGLCGYRESLGEALALLMDVTDMEASEAYRSGAFGDLLTDETEMYLFEGDTPSLSGPIQMANSVADALILQYYEEADDLKAAFGHELSMDDWKKIGSVLGTYEEILFTSPLLAVNLAHPMLKELFAELHTPERKFSFLCGHDCTIASVLAALGVEDYVLPGAVEPTTPIGVNVVFERWTNREGEAFYKVELIYQSTEQLRSIQALSPDEPPMIVPLSFEGVAADEHGMMAEKDFMGLFTEKIEAFRELQERYMESEIAA